MVAVFKSPLTADEVKAKARGFGADLVGIAAGAVIDANPPDASDPRTPARITDHDGGRVIVMAKHYTGGTTRILRWDDRHKYYNDELTLTALEEASLELVFWLEDRGYPAIVIPPTHVDPWRYMDKPSEHQKPLLSMEHAAVEAGLGTLGLNRQLLTPEFGPRVLLTAVLTSIEVECDAPMAESLCLGPACGRCLKACPGDVIRHWDRDWDACDTYRSPYGFAKLAEHVGNIIEAGDPEAQKKMLRSEESFYLWQSILRGAGAITGCRRCQDVCPVGADYERMLADALEAIPEETPAKAARLREMAEREDAGELPETYGAQARWIGRLGYLGEGD